MRFNKYSGKIVKRFVGEVEFYRRVLRHPGTPRISKILLGAAIAYAVSPIDIIPDFLPVVGYLDDLIVLPLLIWMAVRMIPGEVIAQCGQAKANVAEDRPGESFHRASNDGSEMKKV